MTTESSAVDINTDDLDAFTDLLNGKVEAAVDEDNSVENTPEAEAVEPDPLATESEDTSEPEATDGDDRTKLTGKKPVNKTQERIQSLVTQLREAERREAEALRKLTERTEPEVKTPAQVKADDAPDPDEKLENGEVKYPLGEFDPAFIRDQIQYTFRKEREAAAVEDQKARERARIEEARSQLVSEWEGKLVEAEARQPGYRDKIAVIDAEFSDLTPEYGEFLATTIMSLDNGTDILGYLADNLDEARRIAESGPALAAFALGRIEGKLFSQAEAAERLTQKISAAPIPPTPLRGSGQAKQEIADDTDDLDAFAAKLFRRK